MSKILVIDDESNITELIKYTLEKDNHEVIVAFDGEEGLQLAQLEAPDLIILDIMLPKLDGLEVCRRLRSQQPTTVVPILMVSARGETIDNILGLEMGADDYIAKPFSTRELAARVKANLRRLRYADANKVVDSTRKVSVRDVVLDLDKYEVTVAGQLVSFTPKEFKLLKILITHPGKVFTRDVLLDRVWGFEYHNDSRTVDVHIRYIRQKIEKDPAVPKYIITVRGVGYKFD
ncbi:winged helix-turn-helix domain-containing protein [Desulforamulus aeronauticus]|uniref:Stage 0 sporulation protein A homolog n=1 Tax=Desulforamulus aeronauticus DSM 10349 TaxID=1121421 RepID=A0A1M6QXL8_9FIRM|nr:response regulator transcription factor [Desulforamulus aeronauticus]SHK24945.1 two-component system, OmpR family, alkaline phosphatase synthesis response regulator PhoP [Desulforamulus aeronauticus DSM 10349]